jgi:uncharacterized protein (DUF2336 family)
MQKHAETLRHRKGEKERCHLAREMAAVLDQDGLSDKERHLAEEIIARLVEDELEAVRIAVAQAVAASPSLPVKLAEKLARDIVEVSLPVLKLSPVLKDRFLEEIIRTGIVEKLAAIAERETLSERVSRQLVSAGRKGPVIRLLKNEAAKINDHTMVTIILVYGDSERVAEAVFNRGELSPDILVTLRALSEDHVCQFVQRYLDVPDHVLDLKRGRNLLEKTPQSGEPDKAAWWHRAEKRPV